MIKNLAVNNLQSHSNNTKVDFVDGVNVITGETDAGKSVLFRAMDMFANNQVRGDAYRTFDTKKTSIEIDGIQKIKTASTGYYEINGERIKVSPGSTPEELGLNIGQENFQGQHDPYFLLKLNPGERARELNKVADLSVISKYLKLARSKKTNATNIRKRVEEDIETAADKYEEMEWVDELEVLTNRVSSLSQSAFDSNIKAGNIKLDVQEVKILEEFISKSNGLDPVGKQLQLETLLEKIEDISTAKSSLEIALANVKKCQEKIIEGDPGYLASELSEDIEYMKSEESKLNSLDTNTENARRLEDKLKKLPDPATGYKKLHKAIEASKVTAEEASRSLQTFGKLAARAKGLADKIITFPVTVNTISLTGAIRDLGKVNADLGSGEINLRAAKTCKSTFDALEIEHKEMEEAYNREIEELGECPLCGRGEEQ